MKNAFYYVDEEYIDYLKQTEIVKRGFTTVPNVKYANRNKFLYGAILNINDVAYFVPVTSYDKKQIDNILINVGSERRARIEGSLRFNYMIPVPSECLHIFDFKHEENIDPKRKRLLDKEYRFCKRKQAAIEKQALRTYKRVLDGQDEGLLKNSCDFVLLEEACKDWIRSKKSDVLIEEIWER